MKTTLQKMKDAEIAEQLRKDGYSDSAISKLFEDACRIKRAKYFSKNLIIQTTNKTDCQYILDCVNEFIEIYGRCSVGDLEYIIAPPREVGRITNLSIIPETENHNQIGWDSPIKYDGYRNETEKLYCLYLPYPKNLSDSEVSSEVSDERNSETEESLFESIEVNGLEVCSMRKNVQKIRLMFRDIETAINDICPERSRDKSIGLTELENAYMRFSQAIVKANK